MAVTLPAPTVQDPAAQQNFEYLASGVSWPGTSIGQGTITGGTGGNIGQGTITGGIGGNIAATSITANELAAGSVTAGKINVTQLSAITANMGTLTSGTITGATVQSGSTGARWVGDAGGLRGYAADGTTVTFGINTADGSAIFNGTVTAGVGSSGLSNIGGQVGTTQIANGAVTVGKLNVLQLSAITADMGTLTAGVITGATVRTASSGSRVEMTSSGFVFYESDGTTKAVNLSSSTSGLTLLAGTSLAGGSQTRRVSWAEPGGTVSADIRSSWVTLGNTSEVEVKAYGAGSTWLAHAYLSASITGQTSSATVDAQAQVGVEKVLARVTTATFGTVEATLLDRAGNSLFPGRVTVAKLNSSAYVTSLPGSPSDGDEIYYAADATNSVIWHLRWRATARGVSGGAWEFIGGPPLFAEVTTSQGTTSATYTNLATTGPSVTVPLNGDYDVRFGADMEAVASQRARATVKLGGSAAGDGQCVTAAQGNPAGAAQGSGASRVLRLTGRSASDVLLVQYRVDVGGTNADFFNRFISVTPARVW